LSRRVLAISHDLQELRRIVANLERAGAEVDAVRSVEAAPGFAGTGAIQHRYVFYAVHKDRAADLARDLRAVRDGSHVAVIAESAQLPELVDALELPPVNHVIVGEELDRGVFVTAQKLLTGDIFGIEKYLPEGTPVHYARIRDFEGRAKAVETVLEFAQHARMRRQVKAAIAAVCEELLMNALYDAPVDAKGRPLFADVAPETLAQSRSPKPVSIRYAATESQFAVAVRDRFGRLAKDTIISYIKRCLSESEKLDRKSYGEGIGLYLIANAAASYVVNVAHGIATEVVCTFDRGAKTPLRLVGVFVHPGPAPTET
jgi:hypothetical protein